MKIDRDLAIKILKYQNQHKDFYFPFLVMCREYSNEDEDFVEVEPNEWRMIKDDYKYQTFELWGNLQNLYGETVELMAKGFIEKILNSGKFIRNYIFYTTEGFTFLPNSKSDVPDVENCQVLGWGNGINAKDAFNDFKKQNRWLKSSKFNEVICAELKDEKTYNFNLKK
ncbi:MAG: hypothetical protein WC415_05570 [Patescibacteria group bacterium]|jgi:hypothetical protein